MLVEEWIETKHGLSEDSGGRACLLAPIAGRISDFRRVLLTRESSSRLVVVEEVIERALSELKWDASVIDFIEAVRSVGDVILTTSASRELMGARLTSRIGRFTILLQVGGLSTG